MYKEDIKIAIAIVLLIIVNILIYLVIKGENEYVVKNIVENVEIVEEKI